MKKTYHSLLFVPAVTKMLSKIDTLNADAVIIDLEDAILSTEKEKALSELENFLETYSYEKDIFVRVNIDRQKKETVALNKYPIKGYMLPKTGNAEQVYNFHKLIPEKQIIALIESAEGMVNLREIISNKYVHMVAFGAEDYTTSTGIKNEDIFLSYPKSKMVLYAKAYGKPAYDTVCLNVTDKNICQKSVENSKDYGFDGKLAIHPMQVDIINSIYKNEDKTYYQYILDEYQKAGKAVLKLDGRIYEKPHIEKIKRLLREE